ncbi:hypothetical protein CRM90_13400 [Mycobacterium sp. ENV421]|uniref:hypothetical protein n=1 Tax=Mycobacterium sp. ENV421 TaxID=1213407 RepID=UPI000C9996AE|nr:hypothetical protein [Mycobacterium sp. ENV421]PND57134.1 hypothetical protein CRM90_13400 [Mycobacterium sp. ENV421]
MPIVRVNFVPGFYLGDDAVLLTLDGSGVDLMKSAIDEARASSSSLLLHDGIRQEFVIEPGTAAIELQPTHVVWQFDTAKAAEIADNLAALGAAGHFYVDITSPAETLLISRDEYTDVVYPWISPR